jgi:branched-chain amino acid transport system substrate-binding protein
MTGCGIRFAVVALGMAALAPSHAARAQNIVIGVSTGVSGPVAVAAERERWGIDLAVEQVNAAGGVLGRKLETMVLDNRCNPSEAVNVANKLVEAKVPVMFGAHCSSATLATMPIIKEAGIPMITGISSSAKITELSGVGGNPWMFRINPADDVMMKALGKYLGEKKVYKSVAIVAEDTDFGRGGAEQFVPAAQAAGITIVSTDYAPQNTPDFTSILTRIQQRRPDAIALFQVGGDQINFLRFAMQLGIRIPYTGRAELGGENTQIIKAGGMENSLSAWNYSYEVDAPENKAFDAAIFARHKLHPVLQTWAGYDRVRMLAQAIKEAGSAEPAKIRDALAKLSFKTVMGPTVRFDDRNQAGKVIVLQAVKDREIKIVDLVQLD